MWTLFSQGKLRPDSKLSGEFVRDESLADLEVVMLAIDDAREEALRRQLRHEAQAADGS
jgi:RIO kinase 1